jgi:hypothetical protein
VRDAKRKLLRIAALGVVLISLAIQIMVIGDLWWDFDPRRSCDRLLYWDEWIACLHGTSHMYILSAEVAAMT